jgi:hypothetical protein
MAEGIGQGWLGNGLRERDELVHVGELLESAFIHAAVVGVRSFACGE